MNNKILIKLSVGIGRNLAEAEEALKIAKTNKNKHKKFNIEIYNGPKLKYTNIIPSEIINAYLRLEKKLSNSPKELLDLEILKKDPKTKLLNKLGYYIELQKLELKKKYNKRNRFIILFDADSMHLLNKKYGYETVDRYLEAIGKALSENIRYSKDRNEKDLLKIKDLLNNRKNDAAGDEFIIDLSCNKKYLKQIAERYITNCYEYQKKLK
ncbi:MAG TPA: diguanylate cyclase [archaeon]|jgi:GGDEF domain-containing protein|nr:diguanylate cyclase [archaeon]